LAEPKFFREGAELAAGGDRRKIVQIHAKQELALLVAQANNRRLAALDVGAIAGGIRHFHHLESDQWLTNLEWFWNQFFQRLAVGAVGDIEIFPPPEPMRALDEGWRRYWRRVLLDDVLFLHGPTALCPGA
jgi:hypothetical protein